jgi:hypothetical protein
MPRWRCATAAGMLEAAKGFRRLKAYSTCRFCAPCLRLINPNTSSNELKTMLMPHSIIHGDARFAYFNKSGAFR